MGFHLQNLLRRLSNVFSKDENSTLAQLLGAVGEQLDVVDPAQSGLAENFSISKAKGEALDRHGHEWGVPRRIGEADEDYKKRIRAVVPIYTTGPTVSAISKIVENFTGHPPEIVEFGPHSFTMGVTPMGDFVFSDRSPFEFLVQVRNPLGTRYKRADLEEAVNLAKPARATAIFIHDGGE
jgi:Uncharacterised protein conserved in bacteria (DUF2313)